MANAPIHRALAWIRHRLTAWNTTGEGIHSPWLFYIVRMLVRDENAYYCWHDIEQRRAHLLNDSRQIVVMDYGSAGSPDGKRMLRRVSEIASTQLERPRIAQLLFKLAVYMGNELGRPLRILELGTSLGLTTAYLAMADKRNRVVTMEGSRSVLGIAKEQWKALKIENIEWKEGPIDDSLLVYAREQWDIVFIDANHTYAATIRYADNLIDCMYEKGVVMIDDIHYSDEMERAWRTLKADPRVTSTMDLYDAGLLFVDPHYLKRHYKIIVGG